MPKVIWLYLTALLYYRTSSNCVAFVEALETVSHDRLPRVLQVDWSRQTLLERAFRTLFGTERGYLIVNNWPVPGTPDQATPCHACEPDRPGRAAAARPHSSSRVATARG